MSVIGLIGAEEFFAPVSSDLVDGLVGQYRAERAKVEEIGTFFSDASYRTAVSNFMEASKDDFTRYVPDPQKIFDVSMAIPVLNASYWNKALRMTDVLDVMPQTRRDEWFEQIKNPHGKKRDKYSAEYTLPPIPEFTEEAVRSTLTDLLLNRSKFFAERVDGIFRSLSREHVTNRPEGFGKRMILQCVISEHGYVESSRSGHIADLRKVIAKFMGRDEPHYSVTTAAINAARRNNGEWMPLDGGALRIRVYNGVGTAHLEVHPDMAWRLNAVLASLYPHAIPSELREPPRRKPKDVVLMEKPLPFAVVEALAGLEDGYRIERTDNFRNPTRHVPVRNSLKFRYGSDKHASQQVHDVLMSIGAVFDQAEGLYRFDYSPREIIDQIVCSGCIPDHKSHQFYPTPEALGRRVIEMADIMPGHTVLEPSAGIGGLADLVPDCRHLTCVEVSELHARVLSAKGCYVITGDFLKVSSFTQNAKFDRIVMNPPFDQGRWRAHLEHAADMLLDRGRLVAILPSGAKTAKDLLPGFHLSWHGPFDNQFAGASVSVVIVVAERWA